MAPKLSYITSPCMWCVRAAKWLPVLFIVAVVVWSYYAYVIQLNLFTIKIFVQKILYLIIYHVLLVMFLWSYWQTIFTDIGRVPKQFRLPPAELERYLNAETQDIRQDALKQFCQRQLLPVTNRTLTGDIRYCDKCCHVKPDRCHHCSVCGECVLKMDHHCPWVNNCVAFTNYKFFVLFLGYALIYCLFIAATTLEYFIKFWTDQLSEVPGKFHILFVFFVSIMFAISLVSLFGYHIFLITRNRSTLESFRAPIFRLSDRWVHDKEGFSLGTYNNFIEIFGDNKSQWFLPIFTSAGDGVLFPLRSLLTSTSSSPPSSSSPPGHSYGSTNTSLGDGVSYPQRCVDEDTDGLLGPHQRWADNEEIGACFNGLQSHPELEEVIVQSNHTNPI